MPGHSGGPGGCLCPQQACEEERGRAAPPSRQLGLATQLPIPPPRPPHSPSDLENLLSHGGRHGGGLAFTSLPAGRPGPMLPHHRAWVPSPTSRAEALSPLPHCGFPRATFLTFLMGGEGRDWVILFPPSVTPLRGVGSHPSPSSLYPLFSAPKGGGGGGAQPLGPAQTRQDVREIFSKRREGDEEEGWGWPTLGSRFCCRFFLSSSFPHFSGSRALLPGG